MPFRVYKSCAVIEKEYSLVKEMREKTFDKQVLVIIGLNENFNEICTHLLLWIVLEKNTCDFRNPSVYSFFPFFLR